MINPALEYELHLHLDLLPVEEQRQVIDFARALALTKNTGSLGNQLLRFAGTIAQDDLLVMNAAIERDCEQVNPNEW